MVKSILNLLLIKYKKREINNWKTVLIVEGHNTNIVEEIEDQEPEKESEDESSPLAEESKVQEPKKRYIVHI